MNKEELKKKIESLKKGIASPVTPANMKENMQKTVDRLEQELVSMEDKPTEKTKKGRKKGGKKTSTNIPQKRTKKVVVPRVATKEDLDECKSLIEQRRKEYRERKLRLKKREEQGKPPTPTATETVKKGTESAVKKVEVKAEKGKSVTKDLSGIFNSIKDAVKDLEQYKEQVDKKAVRSLIAELEKFL